MALATVAHSQQFKFISFVRIILFSCRYFFHFRMVYSIFDSMDSTPHRFECMPQNITAPPSARTPASVPDLPFHTQNSYSINYVYAIFKSFKPKIKLCYASAASTLCPKQIFIHIIQLLCIENRLNSAKWSDGSFWFIQYSMEELSVGAVRFCIRNNINAWNYACVRAYIYFIITSYACYDDFAARDTYVDAYLALAIYTFVIQLNRIQHHHFQGVMWEEWMSHTHKVSPVFQ